MPDENEVLLWDVKQVAKALGIGERTVWKHTHAGELPSPIRIGRSVRWARRDIETYLDAKLSAGGSPRRKRIST